MSGTSETGKIRVRIIGAGAVSALGENLAATRAALRAGHSPLRRAGECAPFSLERGADLPVGGVGDIGGAGGAVFQDAGAMPRSHQLALKAAREALSACPGLVPDAVVVGTTTGGILSTEDFLRKNAARANANPYHGLHTVTDAVARLSACTGPALTVSTACSSGALALALALRMLRQGRARRVLAGGADSLCRLTYFGFHSLQLVDADGPKPFDLKRQGMAVAEGAAFLLLTSGNEGEALAELSGAGLSCDAHHPSTPHPEGDGALAAMQAALADAGLRAQDVDYINLHGTATPENDKAEAKAIRRLFADKIPPLSSIKGATGHSLAAAGALEAVVSALALHGHFVPANTGFADTDPELGLTPQVRCDAREVQAVLSNSFGFGGNNGALVLTGPGAFPARPAEKEGLPLAVLGASCLTGAGDLPATLRSLDAGQGCAALVDEKTACAALPPRQIRRLKRLARLGLALAEGAKNDAAASFPAPLALSSVFFGTGWGALSETADFLARLHESGQQFPSPTDFVGSVHNAPAGQIALLHRARGANVTASGGRASFAEAAFAASLLACRDGQPALLIGADEYHETWLPMLDADCDPACPADGGGALLLVSLPGADGGGETGTGRVLLTGCELAQDSAQLPQVLHKLGGQALQERVGLILTDYPEPAQLADLQAQFPAAPLWNYPEYLGRFASSQAVAATLAVAFLERGFAPACITGQALSLAGKTGKSVLLIVFTPQLSVLEFTRP